MILKRGDLVGIISCSDGLRRDYESKLMLLMENLQNMGLKIELAKTLYRTNGPFSGSPVERATELMKLYTNENVKAIFDISGGDSANQILDYLDYEQIKNHEKPYVGMSDLSVILNAIYTCTKINTYHYTIRNLIGDDTARQIRFFTNTFFNGSTDLCDIEYSWLRGNSMKGAVIGGNIRCFMKLAGTKYLPDPKNKILFLEALGGGPNRLASLIAQLKHIGYLDKINGIMLGTFTQMESYEPESNVDTLVLEATMDSQIPVVKTKQLGHGDDAKCIVIGKEIELTKNIN